MPKQKLTKFSANQAGFTLVELLIVVIIIGILSVIGLNNFMSSQMKARDSQRKSDLATIAKTLEMYYADEGSYPVASEGKLSFKGTPIEWGSNSGFVGTNGTIYLTKMPFDPSGKQYFYNADLSVPSYKLCALLENTKDKAVNSDGYFGTDCNSNAECNYCITSSNVSP